VPIMVIEWLAVSVIATASTENDMGVSVVEINRRYHTYTHKTNVKSQQRKWWEGNAHTHHIWSRVKRSGNEEIKHQKEKHAWNQQQIGLNPMILFMAWYGTGWDGKGREGWGCIPKSRCSSNTIFRYGVASGFFIFFVFEALMLCFLKTLCSNC